MCKEKNKKNRPLHFNQLTFKRSFSFENSEIGDKFSLNDHYFEMSTVHKSSFPLLISIHLIKSIREIQPIVI